MFRRPERNEIKDEIFVPPVPDTSKYEESASRFPVRKWDEDEKDFQTFNEFIDYWYSEHAATLSREALLEKAEKWYNINRSKKENALNNLLEKQESFKNAAQLKHQGDLILSYGYMINSSSKFLECEDYETGKTVKLLIDPAKSPQENAQVYYKNYKKAVSGAEELTHDIEIVQKQLEKLML